MVVDTLSDEEGRLGALHRLGLSRTGPYESLDRIVKIALAATGAPMAAISVLERSTQTILAARGIDTFGPLERGATLCEIAIAENRPLIVEDCLADRRTASNGWVLGGPKIGGYLAVPLVTGDGYVIGVLEVMDAEPRQFTENDITIAVNLARLVVSQLSAHQLETVDYLTGIMTRRAFQAEVEREYQRASRYDRPSALVFLDLDGFRTLNSALGLQSADEVLKAVANVANERLRVSDVLGRIGGEEFGLLLPETLAYEASQCAERLREEIARLRFRNASGTYSVTASFGIAPLNPAITSGVHWFSRADVALYGAKQLGRDCVAFAPAVEDRHMPITEDETVPVVPRLH